MVYFEYGYADEPKFEGCFEILKRWWPYLLDTMRKTGLCAAGDLLIRPIDRYHLVIFAVKIIIRLGISIIYRNHVAFNGTGFMPPTWNDGMLESWNNGQKTHNFRVWIKVIGINFHCFAMIVYISTGDNQSFVAIMTFPDKWLSLFDVEKLLKAQDTISWENAYNGCGE